jgi:hypothetical protein
MPQATDEHTPSRRRLLTGSAATLLAGAAAIATTRAATPEATGDDSRLVALADQILALHAEYDRQWDEHDAIEEQHRTAGTATATLVRDSCRFLDEIHPLSRRVMALRQEMARTPATTMAGFRAKALIVEQFLDCWPGDSAGTEDEAVAWSLANDLLGKPSVWREPADMEDV